MVEVERIVFTFVGIKHALTFALNVCLHCSWAGAKKQCYTAG